MLYPPPVVGPQRRPARTVVLVVLGVLVALLAGFIVAREMVGTAAAQEITREPVASAGENPFMPSVGADQVDVRPVSQASGRYAGNTPGLFGGSGDDAVCDRSQLSRYLGQHPDKAAGWAGVLGVSQGDVSRYVAGLTPVVLRSDTFVTNHGWRDGEITAYPAVLQAGTAVLVDRYGQPVTRCFCGNPLSAPMSFGSVYYAGPVWQSFSSTSITVIQRTTTITNNYTLVDVHTGEGRSRPIGTDGGSDTDAPTAELPSGGTGDQPPASLTDEFPDNRPGTLTPGGPGSLGETGEADGGSGADDLATTLTSSTWTAAGSACPMGLTSGVLRFVGDTTGSVTSGGAPVGGYTLAGDTLTIEPSASSASSASSGGSGSSTPPSTAATSPSADTGTTSPSSGTSTTSPSTGTSTTSPSTTTTTSAADDPVSFTVPNDVSSPMAATPGPCSMSRSS